MLIGHFLLCSLEEGVGSKARAFFQAVTIALGSYVLNSDKRLCIEWRGPVRNRFATGKSARNTARRDSQVGVL